MTTRLLATLTTDSPSPKQRTQTPSSLPLICLQRSRSRYIKKVPEGLRPRKQTDTFPHTFKYPTPANTYKSWRKRSPGCIHKGMAQSGTAQRENTPSSGQARIRRLQSHDTRAAMLLLLALVSWSIKPWSRGVSSLTLSEKATIAEQGPRLKGTRRDAISWPRLRGIDTHPKAGVCRRYAHLSRRLRRLGKMSPRGSPQLVTTPPLLQHCGNQDYYVALT